EELFSRFSQSPDTQLSDSRFFEIAFYRKIFGLALAIIAVLVIAAKVLWLKSISYEVTRDRIEWSRGIFNRKIDNIDMFRVIDLRLQKSLLDCIVGIGTVGLITTDKTDPQFTFEKIKKPNKLYDIIKKASLEADKRNSVIHLE
ncbi:MAG: PH domain-containing protein, partial [Planctomycetota bacterium]